MLALKVVLYYFACLCMSLPILTGLFRMNETEAERKSKISYPWRFMRGSFITGLVLLTIAVALTLYC